MRDVKLIMFGALVFGACKLHEDYKINPFTAMMSLENDNKSAKFEIVKPLCFLFRNSM